MGAFATTYRGWAGYDGARDTSRDLGRPPGQQGLYNSATTTSVANGVVDKYLHTVGRTPQVMALTPPLSPQTHGRYSVRFRSGVAPGYKVAWLLWPASNDWQEGEIDFPEGPVGGDIQGYAHDTTGDPSRNVWSVRTGVSMTQWHIATIEWMPERITFDLDGYTWTTTDPQAIPTHPMRWVLQTETELNRRAPDRAVSGHVYIDWVAVWARA
jgi:hypothetical protein